MSAEDVELLNDCIEELTTTGKQELDVEEIKNFKNLCKKSSNNVKLAYQLLMEQLQKDHAEIRYSTFQVVNELFIRSHLFRELVIFNLQNIFMLTIETEKRHEMPAPFHISRKLKHYALLEFNKWFHQYSKGYPKLQLGFEFLRDVKKIKFKDLEVQTLADQKEIAKKIKKEKKLIKSKLEQVEIQFNDLHENIKSNIKQMESCFELVVPKAVNEQLSTDDHESTTILGDQLEDQIVSGNDTGIVTSNFTVAVAINTRPKIHETSDNTDILKQLTGLYREVNKQSATVKRWLNTLVKCRSENSDRIKEVLDLKNKLTAICNQYNELDIKQGSDDDDEEFVDVPEKCESTLLLKEERDNIPGPSTSADVKAETCEDEEGPSSSRIRDDLLKVAPVVPFDTDLKFWDSGKIEVASSVKFDSLHRFWKTSEHEETFLHPQVEASMRERRIVYESKFEPVTRICSAILPSGRPCERMDRYKCPFHGPIIERDMFGNPSNPRDKERELKRKREKEHEERVNIQKDIDAVLGTSLSKKKKKNNSMNNRTLDPKEKSKQRYSRLTKIKETKDTPGIRLKKIIFSSRSLDKVYNSINSHRQKKHEQKFGSNFNYN